MRAAGEKRRNSAVVKSLRRSENLQLREEVMRCRQRYALFDLESLSASIFHEHLD